MLQNIKPIRFYFRKPTYFNKKDVTFATSK